jgi:geranylgeranylglycerol-phosphate geranylgeranyltransferase
MAIPFIFGNLLLSPSLLPSLVAISGVAFVAGLGREIIKSAEDVEGDVLHRNARTLPAVIGVKKSLLVSSALYMLLVPLSLLPFALGLRASILSLGLVAITALTFASMAKNAATDHSKESLISQRKASLLALALGLAGYAASIL